MVVELGGDLFGDLPVVPWLLTHFIGDDDGFLYGEIRWQGGFATDTLGSLFRWRWLNLRCGAIVDGLFWLLRVEEKELAGIDLFGTRTEDFPDEKIDFLAQQFVLGGKAGVLGDELVVHHAEFPELVFPVFLFTHSAAFHPKQWACLITMEDVVSACFSARIIPRKATAVAHVDAVHEHGEGFGIERYFPGCVIHRSRPAEAALF